MNPTIVSVIDDIAEYRRHGRGREPLCKPTTI